MCAVFEVSYVRLTARFDANVFLELELEEVCFSANTVHLAFSENVGITATSSFVYRKANETLGTKTIVPVIASDLMQVAGKRVTQAQSQPDGTLMLTFENGDIVTFIDDQDHFESYYLRIRDTEIIV